MDEKQQLALLGQCKSIKQNAKDILDNYERYYSAYIEAVYEREKDPIQVSFISSDTERTIHGHLEYMQHELNALLSTFEDVVDKARELGIIIKPPSNKVSVEGMCRKLIVHCDSIITAIEYSMSPLSIKDRNLLDTIKKDIENLCINLDSSYEININTAIESLENGHYLGSSMIIGRIISTMLSQIHGRDILEKIQFLKDKGIIDKDREDVKENIIKANKKARDFISHKMDIIPDAPYTLGLLLDCVSVMKIYSKAINYNQQT